MSSAAAVMNALRVKHNLVILYKELMETANKDQSPETGFSPLLRTSKFVCLFVFCYHLLIVLGSLCTSRKKKYIGFTQYLNLGLARVKLI